MKLVELSLQNVRGAPDGTYSFAQPSTGIPLDLVLITGAGGSGKTSMLDAIAAVKELVGGYGPPPDPARLRRTGTASGKIAARWLLSERETRSAGLAGPALVTEVSLAGGPAPLFDPGLRELFGAYSTDRTNGKVELFPASRRLSLAPVTWRMPPSELTAKRLRLSKEPAKYAAVQHALIDHALRDAMTANEHLAARGLVARWEQSDSLAPVKRSLAALAPWLRLCGVEQCGSLCQLRFLRSDGVEVTLEDLSDSEQQALLFSAVFEEVGLSHSIVLIDQPELFIHPADQVRWMRAIEALGTNNQIIAATTSAPLLQAADPQCILQITPKGQG